jgi:hypothetical protein
MIVNTTVATVAAVVAVAAVAAVVAVVAVAAVAAVAAVEAVAVVAAVAVHKPVLTTFVTKAMTNVGNSTTTTIITGKGVDQAAELMGPIETTKQAAQRDGKRFYTSLSQPSYFRSFWHAYGVQE